MIGWVIILGLGLRLISINQSLWLDEAISAIAARDYSFLGIIKDFLPGDTHPPLYYLLLKIWSSLFGDSEISLRLPSVIFGIGTVAVVFLIGKNLGGKRLALTAGLFTATAPLLIYYSHEVRMYSLSTFLVSLAVLMFFQERWLFFSLSLLMIGLTDYLPLLILPAFWVVSWVEKKNINFWKKFLLAHLPLLVFLVLWFPIFKLQSQNTGNYLVSFPQWANVLGKASFRELSLVWIKFILGRISFSPQKQYFLVIGIASLPFVLSLVRALKFLKKNLLCWLWLVFPLALAFAGSIFIPGFSYFRLIFVLPAFYLLTALGLDKSKFSLPGIALILMLNLFFSGIYLSQPRFQREDWRGAVNFIETRLQGDELVLMAFPEPFAPYRWYATRPDLAAGSKGIPAEVKKLIVKKKSLYSLDYLMDLTDVQRKTYQELRDNGFSQKEVFNFQGVGQVRYWLKQ